MEEYLKIPAIFNRDIEHSKKTILNSYRDETIESLKDIQWDFTEKVDGTNIRIHWDGHKVTFGGRTDGASIPSILVNKLNELFGGPENEELFEQKFGEADTILFGEGYGMKIQKGGNYIPDGVNFILFDVKIGNLYLRRNDVENIAEYFGLPVVPIVLVGTLEDGVKYVQGNPKSVIASNKEYSMEGIVGRPHVELKDRRGNRIIVKIKWNDLKDAVILENNA